MVMRWRCAGAETHLGGGLRAVNFRDLYGSGGNKSGGDSGTHAHSNSAGGAERGGNSARRAVGVGWAQLRDARGGAERPCRAQREGNVEKNGASRKTPRIT